MFREQTLQTLLYADVKKIGTVLRPRSATNSGKFLTYQVKIPGTVLQTRRTFPHKGVKYQEQYCDQPTVISEMQN